MVYICCVCDRSHRTGVLLHLCQRHGLHTRPPAKVPLGTIRGLSRPRRRVRSPHRDARRRQEQDFRSDCRARVQVCSLAYSVTNIRLLQAPVRFQKINSRPVETAK